MGETARLGKLANVRVDFLSVTGYLAALSDGLGLPTAYQQHLLAGI